MCVAGRPQQTARTPVQAPDCSGEVVCMSFCHMNQRRCHPELGTNIFVSKKELGNELNRSRLVANNLVPLPTSCSRCSNPPFKKKHLVQLVSDHLDMYSSSGSPSIGNCWTLGSPGIPKCFAAWALVISLTTTHTKDQATYLERCLRSRHK